MSIAAQLLVNGLIAGSLYALVAAGFSLIYSTNKFVHFAHGAIVALSAYFIYLFFSILGLNFYVSAVLTIICSAISGLLCYELIYHPLRKRKASNSILLVASMCLLILIQNLILILFGADVKMLNLIKVAKGMEILGAIITPLQIVIILI